MRFALQNICYLGLILCLKISEAYVNIEQYCKAFDANFLPIICILKNNNGSAQVHHNIKPHARPPPPRPEPIYPILYPDPDDNGPPSAWPDFDPDDDDCSCDLTCYPVIANQNGTGVSYRCRSCGSSCSVTTTTKPTCSCAVPSGNATCTCTGTCASFRHDDEDDVYDDSSENSNCIFNISNLVDMRIGEEQMPYTCECCKSKAAENTSQPDFVCICQRTSVGSRGSERKEYFNFQG